MQTGHQKESIIQNSKVISLALIVTKPRGEGKRPVLTDYVITVHQVFYRPGLRYSSRSPAYVSHSYPETSL
jgi:hypothetical protein